MTNKKNATPKLEAKQTQKPSVAERIKYIQERAELVELRHRFQSSKDHLEEVEIEEDAGFFAEEYSAKTKFSFSKDRSNLVSISNPEMVAEIRDFLVQKCNAKIQELDAQLLA